MIVRHHMHKKNEVVHGNLHYCKLQGSNVLLDV